MANACANCGLTFSEIKNQVLLTSKNADIEQWSEHIYSWTIDAERQIGTFAAMHKVMNYKIENEGGEGLTLTPLPDDVYQLLDINFCGQSAFYTGVSNHFNTQCGCGCTTANNCTCIKWFINGCYIQTSRKIKEVNVSYLALPIDEEGFPYVNQNHLDAIVAYIKYMMLQARFDEGKVPQAVYQTRYREWIMRRDAARAKDEIPNDGEMNRLANIWNSKLPVNYRRNAQFSRDYIIVT